MPQIWCLFSSWKKPTGSVSGVSVHVSQPWKARHRSRHLKEHAEFLVLMVMVLHRLVWWLPLEHLTQEQLPLHHQRLTSCLGPFFLASMHMIGRLPGRTCYNYRNAWKWRLVGKVENEGVGSTQQILFLIQFFLQTYYGTCNLTPMFYLRLWDCHLVGLLNSEVNSCSCLYVSVKWIHVVVYM